MDLGTIGGGLLDDHCMACYTLKPLICFWSAVWLARSCCKLPDRLPAPIINSFMI